MKWITCAQCEKEIESRDSFFSNFQKVCLKCYVNAVNARKSIDFWCLQKYKNSREVIHYV